MPRSELLVRHATVNAIACLSRVQLQGDWKLRRACDWEKLWEGEVRYFFSALDAVSLMKSQRCTLPTCPTCAMFVDMALDDGERVRATAEEMKDVRQQLLTIFTHHLTLAK